MQYRSNTRLGGSKTTFLEFVGYLFIYAYVFFGIGYMIVCLRRESVNRALRDVYDEKLSDLGSTVEAIIEEYRDAVEEAEDEG